MAGDAFMAGVRAGLEKVAAATGSKLTKVRDPGQSLAAVTKARQRTPRASTTAKKPAPKPSREMGLGNPGFGTMGVEGLELRAQKLQQPKKPPRY